MNQAHQWSLRSPGRARWLRAELLPWLSQEGPLGDDVLEIGPGPGLTTDMLRELVPRLTALESDPILAAELARRLIGTNVEVVEGDAAASELPSSGFSAVCCFSMFHHVASIGGQNRILVEIPRLLRQGGRLFAEDPTDSPLARLHHGGDVFVPLDPLTLSDRLMAVGLSSIEIELKDSRVKFSAKRR